LPQTLSAALLQPNAAAGALSEALLQPSAAGGDDRFPLLSGLGVDFVKMRFSLNYSANSKFWFCAVILIKI
jgi:hypothetical protein